MIIYKDLVQGSPEWFKARDAKMTASHATAIGNNGKGLETYIMELMSDHFSSGEKEQFSNKHTERGIELEPLAKDIYEMETGNTIETVGFCEHDEFSGCSPDGLVGEDGGVEIKSIDDKGYFKLLIGGEKEISSDYIWQIQMNLLITGRKWWDFMAYNPNYKKTSFIFRIYPDGKKQEQLIIGLAKGREMIKELIKKYESQL